MAKAGRKTYYWDTNCFIAWLDGGKSHPNDVIAGLDEIAKEVNQNRATLCTSVITQAELLEGKLSPEQAAKLDNLFKRRNVIQITVDGRIAKRASEIRNYYNQQSIKISTADSVHLATALIYEVDEFLTLDGDGKRQRASDLLRLNGNVAGHPLHIRVPIAMQGSLLAGVGPLKLDDKVIGGEDVKQPKKTVEPSSAQFQGSSSGPSESLAAREQIKVAPKADSEKKETVKKKEGPPSL